jgi:hypothetical protein
VQCYIRQSSLYTVGDLYFTGEEMNLPVVLLGSSVLGLIILAVCMSLLALLWRFKENVVGTMLVVGWLSVSTFLGFKLGQYLKFW